MGWIVGCFLTRTKLMKKTLLLVLLITSGNLIADEVPESAKICMDCHGDKGVSLQPDIPTIAGAPSVFIEETLFAFRDKIRPEVESQFRRGDLTRPATDMEAITQDLDYRKIIEIADYFANQSFVPANQPFDPKLAELGAKIHFDECEDCHRQGGKSPTSNAARLAGQWTPYLDKAMKYLRSGKRNTDQKMKAAIADMTEQEWQALLAYYASQQD
jgi:cytochrome subunit of sulfide dehydrogenase